MKTEGSGFFKPYYNFRSKALLGLLAIQIIIGLSISQTVEAQLFNRRNRAQAEENQNQNSAQENQAPQETAAPDDDQAPRKRKFLNKLRSFFKRDSIAGDGRRNADAEAGASVEPASGQRPAARGRLDTLVGTQTDARLKQFEQDYNASLDQGDYLSALYYLQMYETIRDSLVLSKIEVERSRAQAIEAENETQRQRFFTLGLTGGVVALLGIAGLLFVGFHQKRKSNIKLTSLNNELSRANTEINQKNEEIIAQNEEIHAQKHLLEERHEDILESITYARRIQEAILPALQHITAAFPNSFVLYKPKDIVSGDFFWFYQGNHLTYIAAVDCTGHGVPGAFMSVLGMSLLNQIVAENPDLTPGEILNLLHGGVIQSLKQNTGSKQSDGMDIALCAFTADRQKVYFAGANNPIYIINATNELEIIKADKAPIGGQHYADHVFTTHEIPLNAGSRVYIFSDGLADQFGGERNKKFTYKRFQQTLLENPESKESDVAVALNQAFDEWKVSQPQIDDVLVIGIRV